MYFLSTENERAAFYYLLNVLMS